MSPSKRSTLSSASPRPSVQKVADRRPWRSLLLWRVRIVFSRNSVAEVSVAERGQQRVDSPRAGALHLFAWTLTSLFAMPCSDNHSDCDSADDDAPSARPSASASLEFALSQIERHCTDGIKPYTYALVGVTSRSELLEVLEANGAQLLLRSLHRLIACRLRGGRARPRGRGAHLGVT